MRGTGDDPDPEGDGGGGAQRSSDVIATFRVTDEFRARMGCGVVAAAGLPAWFAILALALGRDQSMLAFAVAGMLFVVSLLIAIPAVRRMRRLPESVEFDEDGWLHLGGGRQNLSLPATMIERVEVAALPGMGSIRMQTTPGRELRVPDLDDVDGFLATLVGTNPEIDVVDNRVLDVSDNDGDDGAEADGRP